MGGRDCFVGSSQGNPERWVPTAQPCDHSAEHRSRGVFLSEAEEVVVVEITSVRCFHRVRARETHSSLQQNLC